MLETIPVCMERMFSVRDNHTQAKLKIRDTYSSPLVGVSSEEAIREHNSVMSHDPANASAASR
jgi:hypothetical protein